VKEFSKSVNSW